MTGRSSVIMAICMSIEMLLDHRLGVTAIELAEEIEVDRRTAYRYLNALEASGLAEKSTTRKATWKKGERLSKMINNGITP